jgi:hypothetical protein
MMDAAVGGAKLTVKQSVEGLDLREFFWFFLQQEQYIAAAN